MQQMSTVLKHDGPIHLGYHLVQGAAVGCGAIAGLGLLLWDLRAPLAVGRGLLFCCTSLSPSGRHANTGGEGVSVK